jgi:hypothetical protein
MIPTSEYGIPESVEGLDNFTGVGQDGDEVGLKAGAEPDQVLSWPSKGG